MDDQEITKKQLIQGVEFVRERNYVPKNEAIDYLERRERAFRIPFEISSTINEIIEKRYPGEVLYYPATPARVLGVMAQGGQLAILVDKAEDELILGDGWNQIAVDFRRRGMYEDAAKLRHLTDLNRNEGELIHPFHSFYVDVTGNPTGRPQRVINFLSGYFTSVQEELTTDESFGRGSIDKLFRNYPFLFPRFGKEYLARISEDIDWEDILSDKGFFEYQRNMLSKIEDDTMPIHPQLRYINGILKNRHPNMPEPRNGVYNNLKAELTNVIARFVRPYKTYEEVLHAAQENKKIAEFELLNARQGGAVKDGEIEELMYEFYHTMEWHIQQKRNFVEAILGND